MSVSTFAALAPVIDFLRPTKSPYLLMIVFGVIALIKTADSFFSKDEWLMMLIPQFIALIIFTIFAYYGKESRDKNDNIHDQLRFSRAITIATAVMCLSIGGSHLTGTGLLFNVVYSSCLIQLITFLIYTAAILYREETSFEFNFFQFSIITSTFLIGATYCLTQLDVTDAGYLYNTLKVEDKAPALHLDLYLIVSVLMYCLWAFCIKFWINRVMSVVQVKVVDNA